MYKESGEKLASLTRSASSSLKPFGTGRPGDPLPADARLVEEHYHEIKQQYDITLSNLAKLLEKKELLDAQLLLRWPQQKAHELIRNQADLHHSICQVQTTLSYLKPIVIEAGKFSFHYLFVRVAENVLDLETRQNICRQVSELLQRKALEIEPLKRSSRTGESGTQIRKDEKKRQRNRIFSESRRITGGYPQTIPISRSMSARSKRLRSL